MRHDQALACDRHSSRDPVSVIDRDDRLRRVEYNMNDLIGPRRWDMNAGTKVRS